MHTPQAKRTLKVRFAWARVSRIPFEDIEPYREHLDTIYLKESDKIIKLLTWPSPVLLNESLTSLHESYLIHGLFSLIFKTTSRKKQTEIIFKYPEHA